ncbi:putative two-component system response regulator [Plasticicumulans lactativorans]|uniref:Putative two-component system response regulator n=1 Tax=Plasticicumulans lactativorans TaxID=1133106 RepID=A0A4R2L8M7_9GAMM|nr:HD domain-containing phosphohydrolase [Plasticicumulans lactativorans]TCO80569.1 putative two-component system response regulator [Plasticicumulans lactativorans]
MSEASRSPVRILIVDDDPVGARLLATLLASQGYATTTAVSGPEALARVAEALPDLILLDVMMPGMDGFEVANRLKAGEATRSIPIIMVTALDDRDARLRGFQAGVEEFVAKPVDRAELWVRVRNLLRLKEFGDLLADQNRTLERLVAERTAQLEDSYRETIFTLTLAASYKDEETGAHVRRISVYTAELARRLGLDAAFADTIYFASPMHDVGKIAIPDAILRKPGGFTPDEWAIMKTHAALGARMLAGGASPYLRMGAEIAQNHHERWDGSGYPQGLRNEAIPLSARIMIVCDQYDALRSTRPYKRALDHATTLDIMLKGDGRTVPEHFDPAVLAAFVACAETFREIYAAHEG